VFGYLEVTAQIKQLTPDNLDLMQGALDCFATVFDEHENYSGNRPTNEYLSKLISGRSFICLVALIETKIVGALAVYELKKFEQARSEIYIYDLAIYERYRRRGIATSLIEHLKPIAKERGAWVIYVQADNGDEPAVNLYSKLGLKEQVLHFDIPLINKADT